MNIQCKSATFTLTKYLVLLKVSKKKEYKLITKKYL